MALRAHRLLKNGLRGSGSLDRRQFLVGAAALGAAGTFGAIGESPRLRLGALADIHLQDAGTERTFEHALRWFDAQKADAVLIAGDLADWGLTSQLQLVADTWFRVFPGNRRSDGAPIEKLFIYGDHDTGLSRKTLERLVPDETKRLREDIPTNDRKRIWEACFREPWEPIQLKDVKGYKFVLCHFNMTQPNGDMSDWNYGQRAWGLDEFLARHAQELKGPRPFFYVQHRVMKGTVGGASMWGQDDGFSTETLAHYPNAVAFCGHSHTPSTDERLVWQGAFTAIGVPSLSYPATFSGRENGFGLYDRDFGKGAKSGVWPAKQMPLMKVGDERTPVSRHGYLIDVGEGSIRIARRCFVHDAPTGPDWIIPLPLPGDRPFAHDARAQHDPPPTFPPDARVEVVRRNGTDRYGTPTPQFVVSFPPARSTQNTPRAYDYEVQPVLRKGDVSRHATAKRVYSPGFLHPEPFDAAPVTCVFAEGEIPNDCDSLAFSVSPLNAFGRRGTPIFGKL